MKKKEPMPVELKVARRHQRREFANRSLEQSEWSVDVRYLDRPGGAVIADRHFNHIYSVGYAEGAGHLLLWYWDVEMIPECLSSLRCVVIPAHLLLEVNIEAPINDDFRKLMSEDPDGAIDKLD